MANPTSRLASGGRFARLYAACLRSAEWVHAHPLVACAFGAPLVALLIVAVNQAVLLDFPNSGDEYAYLYQAETFAAGRLWNAPMAPREIFGVNYIVQEPHRTFSSFPVGWPLLLALALVLHVPVWLVNPVLSVVTLGLVWALGARL